MLSIRQPEYGVKCADENHGLDHVGLDLVRLVLRGVVTDGRTQGIYRALARRRAVKREKNEALICLIYCRNKDLVRK